MKENTQISHTEKFQMLLKVLACNFSPLCELYIEKSSVHRGQYEKGGQRNFSAWIKLTSISSTNWWQRRSESWWQAPLTVYKEELASETFPLHLTIVSNQLNMRISDRIYPRDIPQEICLKVVQEFKNKVGLNSFYSGSARESMMAQC